MPKKFKARQKLNAIIKVYFDHRPVCSVCQEFEISRETWYKWERQFRKAINTIWGGLSKG
jgi:transposase-like protein